MFKKSVQRFLTAILVILLCNACHIFVPRCKIKACNIRMMHIHRGVNFRGLPWWRLNQNPKTREDFPDIINKKKNE